MDQFRKLALCAVMAVATTTATCAEYPAREVSSGDSATLELEPVPIFSISAYADLPDPVLHIARFGSILGDDLIVVSNEGTKLVFLDPAGRALRVVGGRGSGPGEFGRIDGLFAGEGGFVTMDHENGRAMIFTSTGDFARTITPPIAYSRIRGYSRAAGGIVTVDRGGDGEPMRYRVWTEDGNPRYDYEGPPVRSSIRVSYPVQGGGATVFSLPASCVGLVHTAVVGSTILAADAASGVITAFDPEGRSRIVYRAAQSPITEEVRNALRRTLHPAPRDTIEQVLRRWAASGALLPAWSAILPDPTGRVWLLRAECPSFNQTSGTWDVIDLAGNAVGTISVPDSLQLRGVRGDRVLLVRRDRQDAEHLELYRIRGRQAP